MSNKIAVNGWGSRVRSWFPEREFFMRSQGQVRFITLSSRFQMTAAALRTAEMVAEEMLAGRYTVKV